MRELLAPREQKALLEPDQVSKSPQRLDDIEVKETENAEIMV